MVCMVGVVLTPRVESPAHEALGVKAYWPSTRVGESERQRGRCRDEGEPSVMIWRSLHFRAQKGWKFGVKGSLCSLDAL